MTPDLAKTIWGYDPDSGILTWKGRDGAPAGSRNGSGYIVVLHQGRAYRAHRIAWMIGNGVLPVAEIDHINGDRTDNRLVNLRDVSRAENARNARMPRTNTSGRVGVYFDKRDKNWLAAIKVSGRIKSLGSFATFLEACACREAAEREHGFHANHGRI